MITPSGSIHQARKAIKKMVASVTTLDRKSLKWSASLTLGQSRAGHCGNKRITWL